MLTYCQLEPNEQTIFRWNLKLNIVISVLEIRFENVEYIVSVQEIRFENVE